MIEYLGHQLIRSYPDNLMLKNHYDCIKCKACIYINGVEPRLNTNYF